MTLRLSVLAVLCAYSVQGYAETLAEFEQKLIKNYYQESISSRFDADQYNEQIAQAIMNKVKTDPNSWRYDFKALTDKRMLTVNYSPDKKIKIYQLDVSSGGTMRLFKNIAQWQTASGLKTQLIEEDLLIRKLYQTQLGQATTYFVLGQSIGSTCDGGAHISAYQFTNNKLLASRAFQTKTQTLDQINVPFECRAFANGSPYLADRSTLTEYFIRVDPKMRYIDVQLLNEQNVAQDKYLRYQKQQTHYKYQGVVNR